LIGAGGLGTPVFRGLNSLNVGLAFVGGLGIVLLAIVLDRITQAFADPDRR
jgi:glycine betaine/proline transport system permease protein